MVSGSEYLYGDMITDADNDKIITVEFNGRIEECRRYKYRMIVDINETIPTPIIIRGEGITYMDFYGGSIESVEVNGLADLEYLYLNSCQITSFSINECPALSNLDLTFNQLSSFNAKGLHNLLGLYLKNNQLLSFDGTDLRDIEHVDLSSNSNLTSVIFSKYTNIPSDSHGFNSLDLKNTPLGNMASTDNVWNSIISNLPTRNIAYKGKVFVTNNTLKNELNNKLATKNWVAY
jgi:hypothetical protein